MSHKDFPTIVKNYWDQNQVSLEETITSFTNSLSLWNTHTFKNIYLRNNKLLARILGTQKTLCFNNCDQLRSLENNLQDELLKLLQCEEGFWFLKSKVNWLSLSDKNTKFFHQSVLIERRKNKITQLLKEEGTWISDQQQIGTKINNNFCNILTASPNVQPPQLDYLLMLPKINETLKKKTHYAFSQMKLKKKNALWNINPFKSPGEDGLHAIFYQRN